MRGDDAPAVMGQLELRLPHAGVQRKGVDEEERAPAAFVFARHGLEVAKTTGDSHASIVRRAAVYKWTVSAQAAPVACIG